MTEPDPRGRERFPRFDDGYRQRWIEKGLWADTTLHAVFDETVAQYGDQVAIMTKDSTITFGEWKERADALAAGLLAAGVRPRQLMSVQLPNWPEMCELQIALSRINVVIQPMHLVYREREIANMLRFCDADAVVVPGSFEGFDYASAVRALRPELPDLRLLAVARGEAKGDGEKGFEELIEEGRANLDLLEQVEVDPDDVFYMNFTSGTEGAPKGFMHSHNTLISMMKLMGQFMRMSAPDTVTLAMSPMTHSFGHFTTYQTVASGLPMVLVDRYSPTEVLELVQQARVTSLSGTPAHLFGLLHHPDFEKYDTSSITQVGAGGARSSPELLDELERVWGVKTGNTYGLGENIVHTRTNPADPPEKQRSSVGRPIPVAELKIVDPEDRSVERPAGEVGEIAYRGPTLCVGYYKLPDKTAATRDAEGWFYTGDLGYVDDEGFLYFAGRGKEVINRGGTKIFPKEIEDLLDAHPKVAEAAVVGMPDVRLGEKVCAYVVAVDGQSVGREEINAFLGDQKVMKHKLIEHLIVVDELPMTPTGKVRKAALQDDAARRAGQASQ